MASSSTAFGIERVALIVSVAGSIRLRVFCSEVTHRLRLLSAGLRAGLFSRLAAAFEEVMNRLWVLRFTVTPPQPFLRL